ncbi:MAG: hypothetical protein IPM79_20365 [Polyangiaceae bacterium]|nr:hypothetical protein [Polyangiaceae bacterium]MBK8939909.1 hypothetical protein [Polyangiaceae bacterium]
MSMRWLAALALFAGLLWLPLPARAADSAVPAEELGRAIAALEKGDHDGAILELEGLADAGVLHPDVSFNRGLSYALRARSDSATPGDLGRAAAGFEEAARLRPGDAEAERALDAVRAEVARRRSRQDKNDVIVRPSLDRVVMELLSPVVWSLAAMGASLLLGLGILLRWRPAGWVHVVGAVLAPIALALLLVLAPLAYFARDHAETRRAGVIVAPSTTLETDEGKRTDAPEIPEASLVELGPRRDDKVLVRWGNYEGWAPYRDVRTVITKRGSQR